MVSTDRGAADSSASWKRHRSDWRGCCAYMRKKRTSSRPVTARPPAPRVVTRWILSRPESLTEVEQLRLNAVLANCAELEALTGHVRPFAQMLTERQGERLPEWLDAVRQDDLPSLHTLAAGIDRDRDAVTAGLTLPRNSPQGRWARVSRACRATGRRRQRVPISCRLAVSCPDRNRRVRVDNSIEDG